MARVHFINVSPGDCSIIQHNSGRITMIDICDGYVETKKRRDALERAVRTPTHSGMTEYPTNPIDYAKELGITTIFRFILTHPDMDHMDGLDALATEFSIANFWDTGAKREAPEFGGNSPYKKEDWDRYEAFLESTSLPKAIHHFAGDRFQYANQDEEGKAGGDGLHIVAPSKMLVQVASDDEEFNDTSYVIVYRSAGGKIMFCGDAHDASYEYILEHHLESVQDCAVMIAPHHGRDSGRDYEFLDKIKPKLTLFGAAPKEHQAYDEWRKRKLAFITSDQAGNIVLEIESKKITVYVENTDFAEKQGGDRDITNEEGYAFLQELEQP